MGNRMKRTKCYRILISIFLAASIGFGCGYKHGGGYGGADDDQTDDDTPYLPPHELSKCLIYADDWLPPAKADDEMELAIAAAIESFTDQLIWAIRLPNAGYAEKLQALRSVARSESPALLAELHKIREGEHPKSPRELKERHKKAIGTTELFVALLNRHLADAYEPAVSVPIERRAAKGDFEIDITDAILDRYWTYYHWSEILAGYYDDSDYAFVFEDAGRTSFIDEEVGEAGVEMFMDYWRTLPDAWNDPDIPLNEKLMIAKYTMWDNPHWGNQEYVPEYWRMEPAFVDEDCPLFTGNMMGALAFEYSLTRHPRTLNRLKAIMRAFRLFDRLTLDGEHPLDQEGYDGRIQRGPKTKNLYHEDEVNLMTVESWDPLQFGHNNSWPDHLTGRERKNVSRDQYYGVFLGYYATFQALSAIEDRSPEEEKLYCDVIIHMDMMLEYLFSNRIRPGWGILYNLYSLFEGSCANPPNLTFMTLWAYPGYEEMTGRDYSARFGLGNRLIHALLQLGRLIGGVELSQELFNDAHRGLTALNQYMITLYMSDLTPEEWQFIYPPEVLVENPQWRTLWRRVIALFYRKYGHFGNEVYRDAVEEMLLPENNPSPTPDDICWSSDHGYLHVEPQAQLEDFMLPLTTISSAAANTDDLGEAFVERYEELVVSGTIGFDGTDLPYEE